MVQQECQRAFDYHKTKKISQYDDEAYWKKILERRNDPLPASVQAKIDQYNRERKSQSSDEDDDFDVTAAYIEVRAQAEKTAEEEQRNTPWEEIIQESKEYYQSIPMYDFGLGQMSNEQDMADFYGWQTVEEIRKEIEQSTNYPNDVWQTGHVSKKLWQQLRNMRAHKSSKKHPVEKPSHGKDLSDSLKTDSELAPKKEKAAQDHAKKTDVTQRQRQPSDDYFLTTERGIIRNKTYRELFKGPSTLYEWIWANVVRSQWQDRGGYPIKERYYDNGYLAYCSSHRQLARDCGLHKNKVKEYIDAFSEAGVIKVEHLVPNGKKRGQSVFIIGTWRKGKDETGKATVIEHYFRDDIFLTKKDGQNVSK